MPNDQAPAAEAANGQQTGSKETPSPLNGWLARWPLHPYLLCYFVVASFLAPNVKFVVPLQLLPLTIGVLAGCFVINMVLYFVLKRRMIASSLSCLALAMVFFYEPSLRKMIFLIPCLTVRLPLGPLSMSVGKLLALAACCVIPILATLIGLKMSDSAQKKTNLCLNLLMSGLFLSSSLAVLTNWYRCISPPAPVFEVQDAQGIRQNQFPDIVHVILDAYARDDVYAKLIEGNNSSLTENLLSKNFTVAKNSSANFPFTRDSLYCMMNFDFPKQEIVLYNKCFTDCRAFQELRHLGYRIQLNSWMGMAGSHGPNFHLTKFKSKFWHKSLWGTVATVLYRYGLLDIRREGVYYRSQFRSSMEQIANFQERDGEPNYLQVHVIGGHVPYVFDEQGNAIFRYKYEATSDIAKSKRIEEKIGEVLFSETWQFYKEQTSHCKNELVIAIEKLLNRKRIRPLIVIIQSDHGPRPFSVYPGIDMEDPSLSLVAKDDRDRWPDAYASYFASMASPPLSLSFPDTITPINLFPVLFNEVFGMSIPLQDNRNFAGGSNGQYLESSDGEYHDCTEEVQHALLRDETSK